MKTSTGQPIKITPNPKFTGVSPSEEMGLDIEPTAKQPGISSGGIVEPTQTPIRDERLSDKGVVEDIPNSKSSTPQFPVDE